MLPNIKPCLETLTCDMPLMTPPSPLNPHITISTTLPKRHRPRLPPVPIFLPQQLPTHQPMHKRLPPPNLIARATAPGAQADVTPVLRDKHQTVDRGLCLVRVLVLLAAELCPFRFCDVCLGHIIHEDESSVLSFFFLERRGA